jgi:hypothetical protein
MKPVRFLSLAARSALARRRMRASRDLKFLHSHRPQPVSSLSLRPALRTPID